ncbi:ubiquitin carboxyl-terminal hydrolase 46-like [Xenentodon cancila]
MSHVQSGYRSPPDIKYHGLINQGSTCYLNSVLQVLFMTKGFRQAVMASSERYPDENSCIDLELTTLFNNLMFGTAQTVGVTQKLGIERVYEQSDAAESFEKILGLASADASQVKIILGSSKEAWPTQLNALNVTQQVRNLQRFGIFLSHWGSTLGPSVQVTQASFQVRGIQDFFKDSKFLGEDQLYCDNCCAKHDACARYEIKQHPEVLMLLLKRFEFSYDQMSFIKNSCVVIIPRMLTIPENQTYELYAYVEHFGGLRGGHYTATIKSQDEGRWYNFNDSTVRPVRIITFFKRLIFFYIINLHNHPFQNGNTVK